MKQRTDVNLRLNSEQLGIISLIADYALNAFLFSLNRNDEITSNFYLSSSNVCIIYSR